MMSAPPPTTPSFSLPSNWHSSPASNYDDFGPASSTSFDFELSQANATRQPENHVAERGRLRNSASNSSNSSTRPPKSSGNTSAPNGTGLLFVTATNPTGFKDKDVMQQVRKKAMNNYLEKKPKSHRSSIELNERRTKSRDSNGSISQSTPRDDITKDLEDMMSEVISNDQALRIFHREKRKRSPRTSSPIHSVHSNSSANDDQGAVSPELFQQVAQRQSRSLLDSASIIMAPAPIVMPMRHDNLPYDRYTVRPFQSIGKPFDPFRAMHQASHSSVGVEELKFYCSQIFGTRAMGQYWIPIITTTPHTFLSTLCISSAHKDAMNDRPIESIQTTALRQEIIHMISQSLLDPQKRVDDFNVTALTQLICSEVIGGGDAVLEYHGSGMEAMINLRGGLEDLGKNGWIAKVLTWVSLGSAVLREKRPRQIYLNYWKHLPKNTYPNTATIPESPLWCPRTEFETLKRSERCVAQTYDTLSILKDVRTMTDLFLSQKANSTANTHRSRDNSLKTFYKKITALPSIHELKPNVILTAKDWTYEACRIAAVIQATALSKRIPFSKAAADASLFSSTSSSTSPSRSSDQQQTRHSIVSSSSGISPTNTRKDSPIDPSTFSFNDPTSPVFSPTASSTMSTDTNTSTSLLSSLKIAIDSSSFGAAWTETNLTGVLLWLALVAAPALRQSPSPSSASSTSPQPQDLLRKWFNALAVRCSIVLCFEHAEGVLGAMGRMAAVQEKLRSEAGSVTVDLRGRQSVNGGKKRKTS